MLDTVMKMHIEYELKYGATPEQLKALEEKFSGESRVIKMETTYYDTPDFSLSNKKRMLRCRLENDTAVCTLKVPAGDNARGEYDCRCRDIQEAAEKLCKLAEVEDLTPAELLPVCNARFTRIAKTLTFPAFTAELALDNGVLTGGGSQMPLCEVEVELLSGNGEAMAAFAEEMAKEIGLTPEPLSKFRRALALARGV